MRGSGGVIARQSARAALAVLCAAVLAAAAGCETAEVATVPLPTARPSDTPAAAAPATATSMPVVQPVQTDAPPDIPASSDPAHVVFERAGELWALSLPSRETHLVARGLQGPGSFEQGDPWALAPAGDYLALARNVEGEVTVTLVALPGGETREVGRFAGRIDALHWSHDSTRLAFVINERDELTGDLLEASLRVYDVATWSESVLYRQAYTPSDAYRQELWLEGWVPGDRAIYVALAMDRTGDVGTLYVLDVRGGEPRLVSEEYLLKGGQAVSPSTSRVLLRRRAAGGRAAPLYLAQAGPDGALNDVRLLSPEEWTVGAVAWSPDGRQVVAERLEPQAHGTYSAHLWLLSLDGGAPQQLTADAAFREEQPAWTPDGEAIVFGRWLAAQPQPAGLWALRLGDAGLEVWDEAGARPQAVAGEGR